MYLNIINEKNKDRESEGVRGGWRVCERLAGSWCESGTAVGGKLERGGKMMERVSALRGIGAAVGGWLVGRSERLVEQKGATFSDRFKI